VLAESGPDYEGFRLETPGEVPFADESGLAVPRGEAQYRQQFERLVVEIRAD
jgi:hypothetical protein